MPNVSVTMWPSLVEDAIKSSETPTSISCKEYVLMSFGASFFNPINSGFRALDVIQAKSDFECSAWFGSFFLTVSGRKSCLQTIRKCRKIGQNRTRPRLGNGSEAETREAAENQPGRLKSIGKLVSRGPETRPECGDRSISTRYNVAKYKWPARTSGDDRIRTPTTRCANTRNGERSAFPITTTIRFN